MGKNENAQRISKKEIKTKLIMYANMLERLGMSRAEACDFISGVMNLGVTVREMGDLKHGFSFFYDLYELHGLFNKKGLNEK